MKRILFLIIILFGCCLGIYSQTGPEYDYPVGYFRDSFNYTNTANTANLRNKYTTRSPNDVIYQVLLRLPMDMEISHCGSVLSDTYLTVLDGDGNRVAYNDDYSGAGACTNTRHAYLKLVNLPSGEYYIVSEGYSLNGSITTTIKGTVAGGSVGTLSNNNYVFTITPTIATGDASTLSADNALRTYQYVDGLGRPQQAVQVGVSPGKADLVTYQEFDGAGRESNAWLPVVTAAGNNGKPLTLTNVQELSSLVYADSKAYSKPVYEKSPLNRITEQYGPGNDWYSNGKKVTIGYLTNSSSHPCRWYQTTSSRSGVNVSIVSGKEYYPTGELYVTKSTDEDGNIAYEFKDKLGQVVLTRQIDGSVAHDTYYVYDIYGNLRVVLPPLAADALTAAGSFSDTNATIANYAYLYKYDGRNRVIGKKLPGADWITYVYDKGDRMIFSQDGEQAAKPVKEWTFYLYDAFGRQVLQGTCTNTNTANAKDAVVTTTFAASNTGIGSSGYTSSFAITSPTVHLVNYYDNYDFRSLTGFNNTHFPAATHPGKGLPTASVTAVLGSSAKLYSASYYDFRGRVVNVVSSNNLGGYDKTTTSYTFTGNPTTVTQVHTASGKATQTQVYGYVYDHAERLKTVTHKLNTGSVVTLASNTYDELGRLKTRKKGTLPATTYGYNVRSWLKSITNSTLFSQMLYYNDSYVSSAKRYNGNVGAMSWKVGSEALRGYRFTYDGLDRLTAAAYLLSGAVNTNNSVSGITYDKHGNMKTIQRRGKTTASAYGVIDNLTMTYSGNQLTGVADAGSTVTIAESNDFKKGSTASIQYTYNKNGAMTKDLNKSISAVSYNLLNLPARVTISGINHDYTYSADGRKLQVKQGSDSRDYAGSVIYENGSLKRILTDGGYIENGTYYYYLTDHLGNNRVVASGTGTVAQKNEYYPFGMPFAETNNADQDKQPYKFGDKEFERKNGLNLYDFEARQMDPAIGRFTTMDPLAESYYSISPYAYCNNNPLRFVDPTGMFIGDPLIPLFLRRAYEGNILSQAYSFVHNTAAAVMNAPISIVNSLVSETEFIASNGVGAYLSDAASTVSDAVTSEIDYRVNTPLSQQGADLVSEIKNPQTWENVAVMAAMPLKGAGCSTKVSTSSQTSTIVKKVDEVFTVTPQGVTLPKGTTIPKGFIENVKRPGSYGIMENGKFVEKLRIDPPTNPGMKGPNNSHFHIDNKRKHETNLKNWPK